MAENLKPSDLPKVSGLANDDIFIVEVEPNNFENLQVVHIEKQHLFSGYLNQVDNLGRGFDLGTISGGTLELSSLLAGSGVEITKTTLNELVLNFTGDSESTTASNIVGLGLVSGITDTDLKLKSITGGSNIVVSESNDTLSIEFTGELSSSGPGGAGTQFAFFSDAENNLGPTIKTYYNTPTSDTYLSGIEVDTAADPKVYLRWDGPGDSYMGSVLLTE